MWSEIVRNISGWNESEFGNRPGVSSEDGLAGQGGNAEQYQSGRLFRTYKALITMDHIDYDIDLTPEELELKEAAHTFAKDVLRPAGIKIDQMTPEQVTAPDSLLFDTLRQAAELGFSRMSAPEEMGGVKMTPRAAVLVNEELAWGN